VDLVQAQVVAEQRTGLAELAAQAGQGVVLDLLDLRVHAPAAGVGVAPLGADRDRARLEPAPPEPLAQELLGPAVGTRRVQVTHAGVVCGVQQLVGPPAQIVDAAVGPEVLVAAERDVGGASDGRKPDPHGRNR
jgi:hypothetical protein